LLIYQLKEKIELLEKQYTEFVLKEKLEMENEVTKLLKNNKELML